MGYRKVTPYRESIFTLSQYCGLFNPDTDLNNGYGCRSTSKDKQEPGCCYAWDCPLASETDDMNGTVVVWREVTSKR